VIGFLLEERKGNRALNNNKRCLSKQYPITKRRGHISRTEERRRRKETRCPSRYLLKIRWERVDNRSSPTRTETSDSAIREEKEPNCARKGAKHRGGNVLSQKEHLANKEKDRLRLKPFSG